MCKNTLLLFASISLRNESFDKMKNSRDPLDTNNTMQATG